MADCPKCRGRMTEGFLYLPDTGGRVKWLDGEPGFWKAMMGAFRTKSAELTALLLDSSGALGLPKGAEATAIKKNRPYDWGPGRHRPPQGTLQDSRTICPGCPWR